MAEPPDGFADFVAARSPALIRTAVMLTGDRVAAEDLVQEALAKTWRHWDRVVRYDQPEAFVRRVMVTTNISWWRRLRGRELIVALVPEPARLVADSMTAVDTRHAVHEALAQLPPRQRAVVVLRFFDDLTEQQTADALGCSVGTVKSQTHKALARLRDSAHLADLARSLPDPKGGRR